MNNLYSLLSFYVFHARSYFFSVPHDLTHKRPLLIYVCRLFKFNLAQISTRRSGDFPNFDIFSSRFLVSIDDFSHHSPWSFWCMALFKINPFIIHPRIFLTFPDSWMWKFNLIKSLSFSKVSVFTAINTSSMCMDTTSSNFP